MMVINIIGLNIKLEIIVHFSFIQLVINNTLLFKFILIPIINTEKHGGYKY